MTLKKPLNVRVERHGRIGFTNGVEPSDNVSRLSTDWFSGDLLETLPAAVYVCDAEGIVVAYNRRASELWGRTPLPGDTDEKYCGAHKLFHPDGGILLHRETPMEAVLRTGAPARDMEVVIERPDSSQITALVNIAPLFGVTESSSAPSTASKIFPPLRRRSAKEFSSRRNCIKPRKWRRWAN